MHSDGPCDQSGNPFGDSEEKTSSESGSDSETESDSDSNDAPDGNKLVELLDHLDRYGLDLTIEPTGIPSSGLHIRRKVPQTTPRTEGPGETQGMIMKFFSFVPRDKFTILLLILLVIGLSNTMGILYLLYIVLLY